MQNDEEMGINYDSLMNRLKKLKESNNPQDLSSSGKAELRDIIRSIGLVAEKFDIELIKNFIKKNFHIPTPAINEQIEHGEYLRSVEAKKKLAKDDEMSDSERKQAEELLKRPDLLDVLSQDIERGGLVGEQLNKMLVAFALLSLQQKKPISLLVKGESSAGKNWLVDNVSKFFPPDWIVPLGSITPRALFHLEKPLSHKALLIQELPGTSGAEYPMRVMQSNGKLTMWTVEQVNGRNKTVEKEVDGSCSFINTTTRTRIHNENETRNLDIQIDESKEQTERIHKWQAKCAANPGELASIDSRIKLWRNALSLLKPVTVRIPFAEFIEFPNEPVRVRRDLLKFHEMIELSATLHQLNRKFQNRFIDAEVQDYANAVKILQPSLDEAIRQCSKPCLELLETMQNQHYFLISDAMKLMKCGKSKVEKALKEAGDIGLVGYDPANRRGIEFKYEVLGLPSQLSCNLLTPDELRNKINATTV